MFVIKLLKSADFFYSVTQCDTVYLSYVLYTLFFKIWDLLIFRQLKWPTRSLSSIIVTWCPVNVSCLCLSNAICDISFIPENLKRVTWPWACCLRECSITPRMEFAVINLHTKFEMSVSSISKTLQGPKNSEGHWTLSMPFQGCVVIHRLCLCGQSTTSIRTELEVAISADYEDIMKGDTIM